MRFSPLFLAPLLLLTACDSDDPGGGDGAGPEELITSVVITLTPQGGGSAVRLTATDENGDGVGVEYGARGVLAAGTTYSGTITLRDEPNNVDVNEDVEDEAEAHLFAYGSSVSGVTVAITDTESDYTDDNNNGGDYAVGLTFDVVVGAGASGTGTLSATLYHFDDGPKTSSTATSDDTDIELAFPISVQ